eukprot:m.159561 g.159561  ORF g.159561 m.159561 type:complete len:932 (+) comp17042_c0_seq1:20-2815(+)
MRFLLVSRMTQVVFFTGDDEFVAVLNAYVEKVGFPKSTRDDINLDALQQLFSPLFMAAICLEELFLPIFSFGSSADKACYVVKQYEDFAYYGMSTTDGQHFVTTQLRLLHDLINMLYGPVTSMLKTEHVEERRHRWREISTLMDCVYEQRKKEQCFLVEATEQIQPGSQLLKECLESLEYPLIHIEEDMREIRRGQAGRGDCHGMIFVGEKLLASYTPRGNRPLCSGDVFLVDLFLQYLMRAPRARPPAEGERQGESSNNSAANASSKSSYSSLPNQSHINLAGTSRDVGDSLASSVLEDVHLDNTRPLSPAETAEQDGLGQGEQLEPQGTQSDAASINNDNDGYRTARSSVVFEESWVEVTKLSKTSSKPAVHEHRRLLFLQTDDETYSPYIMMCARVQTSMTLVLLLEGRSRAVSQCVHTALSHARSILSISRQVRQLESAAEAASRLKDMIALIVRTEPPGQLPFIEGEYVPNSSICSDDEYDVFERDGRDMYVYHVEDGWRIGTEVPEAAPSLEAETAAVQGEVKLQWEAVVKSQANHPAAIRESWLVYREANQPPQEVRLRIHAVRGDGSVLNSVGRWSKRLTTGKYSCGFDVPTEREQPEKCGAGMPPQFCEWCQELAKADLLELISREQRPSGVDPLVRAEYERLARVHGDALRDQINSLKTIGNPHINWSLLNRSQKTVADDLKRTPVDWGNVMDHVESLSDKLRSSYGESIITSNSDSDFPEEKFFSQLWEHVYAKVCSFAEFFEAKRKVTINSYVDLFPGLAHFIYIDRTRDTVVAPCLMSKDPAKPRLFHDLVWDMYARAQDYLSKGYTTVMLRSGDFVFSYFLWFEDSEGRPLPVAKELPQVVESCGRNFYKKELVSYLFPLEQVEMVRCFELYTIHFSLLPYNYIVRHCHELVKKLRHNSSQDGADRDPVFSRFFRPA